MKKKVVLVGALVVLLVGGGVGGYLLLGAGNKAKAEAATKGKEKPTIGFKVGELTTNLADTASRRYIQVDVELHVSGEEDKKALEERTTQLRDLLLAILRSKTVADVSGDQGMQSLGSEMLRRINATGGPKVEGVYFGKFMID